MHLPSILVPLRSKKVKKQKNKPSKAKKIKNSAVNLFIPDNYLTFAYKFDTYVKHKSKTNKYE